MLICGHAIYGGESYLLKKETNKKQNKKTCEI